MFVFKLNQSSRKRLFTQRVMYCITQGNTHEIARLMKNYNEGYRVDSEGMTLLHLSAKIGTESMTKFLIKSRVPIEAKNVKRETALFQAVYASNIKQAEILLEAGADVFARNFKKAVLCIALRQMCYDKLSESVGQVFINHIKKKCSGDVEKIAELLKKNYVHVSYVALFDSDVAIALSNKGRNVNSQNSRFNDNTALHISVMTSDLRMIRTLVQLNADKNIENGYHFIPFEITQLRKNIEMMRLVLPDKESLLARYRDTPEMYLMLLSSAAKQFLSLILTRCPVDLTKTNESGHIPLHHLVRNPNKCIWELFDNVGFNQIDVQDKKGMTAMHYALPRIEAVRVLLDKGAKLNIADKKRRPPFLYEADGYYDNYTAKQCQDCIDLLLRRSFHVKCVNRISRRKTLISLTRLKDYRAFMHRKYILTSVVAHIAMLQVARGVTIDSLVLGHIRTDTVLNKCFKSCKKQLEELRTLEADDVNNITYFELLSVDEDEENRIIQYARNKRLLETVIQIGQNAISEIPYYMKYLRNRFLEALRNNVARVLADLMNVDTRHFTVTRILSYLDTRDFKLFV